MSSLNIIIEGDKTGFNSKSAFTKFKDFMKKNGNLDNVSKFIKPEYKIVHDGNNDTTNTVKYKIILKNYIEEKKSRCTT